MLPMEVIQRAAAPARANTSPQLVSGDGSFDEWMDREIASSTLADTSTHAPRDDRERLDNDERSRRHEPDGHSWVPTHPIPNRPAAPPASRPLTDRQGGWTSNDRSDARGAVSGIDEPGRSSEATAPQTSIPAGETGATTNEAAALVTTPPDPAATGTLAGPVTVGGTATPVMGAATVGGAASPQVAGAVGSVGGVGSVDASLPAASSSISATTDGIAVGSASADSAAESAGADAANITAASATTAAATATATNAVDAAGAAAAAGVTAARSGSLIADGSSDDDADGSASTADADGAQPGMHAAAAAGEHPSTNGPSVNASANARTAVPTVDPAAPALAHRMSVEPGGPASPADGAAAAAAAADAATPGVPAAPAAAAAVLVTSGAKRSATAAATGAEPGAPVTPMTANAGRVSASRPSNADASAPAPAPAEAMATPALSGKTGPSRLGAPIHLDLDLAGEGLGALRLRASTVAGELHVSLTAGDAHVRSALTSHATELRRELESSGLDLASLDLGGSPAGRQGSGAETRDPSNARNEPTRRSSGSPAATPAVEIGTRPTTTSRPTTASSLDLLL